VEAGALLTNRDSRLEVLIEWLEMRRKFDTLEGHSLARDIRDLMAEVEKLREEIKRCRTRGSND
jgi:hypothetical protein